MCGSCRGRGRAARARCAEEEDVARRAQAEQQVVRRAERPLLADAGEQLDRLAARLGRQTANEHAVRLFEVADRRALGQKLGIRQNLKLDTRLGIGLA